MAFHLILCKRWKHKPESKQMHVTAKTDRQSFSKNLIFQKKNPYSSTLCSFIFNYSFQFIKNDVLSHLYTNSHKSNASHVKLTKKIIVLRVYRTKILLSTPHIFHT